MVREPHLEPDGLAAQVAVASPAVGEGVHHLQAAAVDGQQVLSPRDDLTGPEVTDLDPDGAAGNDPRGERERRRPVADRVGEQLAGQQDDDVHGVTRDARVVQGLHDQLSRRSNLAQVVSDRRSQVHHSRMPHMTALIHAPLRRVTHWYEKVVGAAGCRRLVAWCVANW